MECFPKWIIWTIGVAVSLAGAQMLVLAIYLLQNPGFTVRYARRIDPWPRAVAWECGVPDCSHKWQLFAWLHAFWKRPWRLRL